MYCRDQSLTFTDICANNSWKAHCFLPSSELAQEVNDVTNTSGIQITALRGPQRSMFGCVWNRVKMLQHVPWSGRIWCVPANQRLTKIRNLDELPHYTLNQNLQGLVIHWTVNSQLALNSGGPNIISGSRTTAIYFDPAMHLTGYPLGGGRRRMDLCVKMAGYPMCVIPDFSTHYTLFIIVACQQIT